MTANITIQQTATGWHIEGVAPYTSGIFTADLNFCDCDGRKVKANEPCSRGYHVPHVRVFLKRLATTYEGKTTLPDVPFDATLHAGTVAAR